MSRIVILAGSAADNDHVARIAAGAERFGVHVERRIGSAHKTPEHVLALLRAYEADFLVNAIETEKARSYASVATSRARPAFCPGPADKSLSRMTASA